MNRNVMLLARMDVFLQAVAGLAVDADGTSSLPAGGLDDAREMSSDAFFAGDATPEARMVKQVGGLIESIDGLDMRRDGSRAIPPLFVQRARDLSAQALATVRAPDL